MDLLNSRPKSNAWRLNSTLLTDPTLLPKIATFITDYFQLNETPDMDPLMIWEVHKCTIWGELIKLGSRHKKEQEKEIKRLTEKNFKLESIHKHSLTIQSAWDLLETWKALQQILAAKTKGILFVKKKINY